MTTIGSTAGVAIRPATGDDFWAIERLLMESGLPTDGVSEIIATRPGDFFVAELHGDQRSLLAVAGLEVCCDNALLRSVAVLPEWRSRGLGGDLVRHIVNHAESQGVRAMYLLTMTAERYFPRLGFERIERSAVPTDIAGTVEFTTTCCATAVVMRRACRAGVAAG